MRQHKLQILADEYLPVDESGIPRQGLKSVANTSFDFRMPKVIASEFLADDDQRKVKGYDHAFLLQTQGDGKKPAARLWSQDGKLQMMVYTTAPALQFYSGNYLAGTPSAGRNLMPTGKGWRWKANCCRTVRIILNGRSLTVSFALARSTPA